METTQQALSHGSVSLMIRCLYLCGQGILAGFSFVTVYNMTSFSSDEEFLLNYQNTANEVRRFFYILSTIALAGGLDACLDVFAPSSTDAMAIVESPTGVKSSSLTADDKASDRNVDSKAYSSTADRYHAHRAKFKHFLRLMHKHAGPLELCPCTVSVRHTEDH